MAEHIMLTSLGTNPRPAVYVLDGNTRNSSVAPAALYTLLPEARRPERMLVFCTPQAKRESFSLLQAELKSYSCRLDVVPVSEDGTEEAVHGFLAALAKHVPSKVELTVDVTQGFRHQAFLTYTGVLYLTALRDVRLRAAYYGMLSNEGHSPFLDVRALVELPLWFHALRVLRDTGDARLVAELVADSTSAAEAVSTSLGTVAEAHASGLPIELGYFASQFVDQHAGILRNLLRNRRLPLADTLVDDITSTLTEQRLTQSLPATNWKAQVSLDKDELARQARIINGYLDVDNLPTAFGLMREWLVLWAMWRTGQESRWLDFWDRQRTADALKELRRPQHRRTLSSEEQAVASAWRHLAALRNAYAHHGLDENVMLLDEPAVSANAREAIRLWREVFQFVPEYQLTLRRARR